MNPRTSRLEDCVLLALGFVIAWSLFCGLGGHPANDDFLYARSVQLWAEDGRWERVSMKGELPASAVVHVVWGTLLSRFCGFSFSVLHASVLVLAWIGAVAVYLTGRAAGATRGLALFLGASLATSPYYFGHAFTFMTDTPATAWMAVTAFCFFRGLSHQSIRWLWAGSAATLMGIGTRQTSIGILLFPAIVIAWGAVSHRRLSRALVLLAASCGLPLVGLAFFEFGAFGPSNAERVSPMMVAQFDRAWFRQAAISLYGSCLLVGFWTLPVAPLVFSKLVRQLSDATGRWPRWAAMLGSALGLLVLAGFILSGGRAYLTSATGYFMQNAHFGPVILSDAYDPGRWGDIGGVEWPSVVWKMITVLSIIGFTLLAAAAVVSIASSLMAQPPDTPASLAARCELGLVLTAAASAIALVVLLQFIFDRYFMVVLAPVFVWLAILLSRPENRAPSGWAWVLSALLWAGNTGISLAFTHDYLAWNQARWSLVNAWLADDVPPETIDGGYEVNGWFRSAEDPTTRPRVGDETLWWSGRAEWFVASGPRPGFEVVREASWHSWVTGHDHEVLGLRRSVVPPIYDAKD